MTLLPLSGNLLQLSASGIGPISGCPEIFQALSENLASRDEQGFAAAFCRLAENSFFAVQPARSDISAGGAAERDG